MRRWAGVGMFVVVSLVLAGCGPASDGEFVAAKRPPSPTVPAVNVPDLKAQLLKVSDLPTGWSTDQDDDEEAEGSECIENARKLFTPTAKDSVDFEKGSLPSFSESIAYFPSAEQAAADLDDLFEAYLGCKEFWIKSDGKKAVGDLNELSFPKTGEQSRALASAIEVEGFTIGLNQVFFRKENLVIAATYLDLGTPDIDEFQDLVSRAYAKLA